MNTIPTNELVANEIKRIFKYAFICLIFGILSYPILYFEIFGASKLKDGIMPSYVQLQIVYRDPGSLTIGSYTDSEEIKEYNRKIFIENSIVRIKEALVKKSIIWSLYIWLISFGSFLVFRYISIGISWVNKNSSV